MNALFENNFDEMIESVKKYFKTETEAGHISETCVDIWNQYAEDRGNDNMLLFDLYDREDFIKFYIDCNFIDAVRDGRYEPTNKRWGLFQPDYMDEKNTKFIIMDTDELQEMIISHFSEIAEYVLAFPHFYPAPLYEAVAWPLLRASKIVDSFQL